MLTAHINFGVILIAQKLSSYTFDVTIKVKLELNEYSLKTKTSKLQGKKNA